MCSQVIGMVHEMQQQQLDEARSTPSSS